jgi:hypothetical protein
VPRMKKMSADSIREIASGVGDIVCMKLDMRDATHSRGILGIVLDAVSYSGGCRVMSEYVQEDLVAITTIFLVTSTRYKTPAW